MATTQSSYSSTAQWAPSAATYGSNVGRTSAHAAERLIPLASDLAPINASSRVLDVGAGAGAVTIPILTNTRAQVTASDLHQSMLDSISAPPGSNLILKTADARHLTDVFAKNSFSHVFCTFMLQTIRTPVEALREMHQVLQTSNGVIGVACWDTDNDLFDIWEKAARQIDPSYRLPHPLFDDPNAWRTQEEVAAGLQKAGFKDIQTEHLKCPFPFESAQKWVDFWFSQDNPCPQRLRSNWTGDTEAVKKAAWKICKEEYDDGRAITTSAVLGVGRV